MEPTNAEAIHGIKEQSHPTAEPHTKDRPRGILMVSGIQFLKAAVLLLTVTLLQWKPEMVNGSHSLLYPLIYVATRGRYDSMSSALQGGSMLSGLILCLGIYSGVIGFGILNRRAWARRTLVFSCGFTLVLFGKSTLWPGPAATSSPNLTNIYGLLVVDAWVFIYLLRSTTVELFETR